MYLLVVMFYVKFKKFVTRVVCVDSLITGLFLMPVTTAPSAPQLSGPRPDSPVELELVKVESGAKRDMFDAALQTCRDVL